MSWFTERAPPPRRPLAPWRPTTLPARAEPRPAETGRVPLTFAEHELARIAAVVAARAAAQARREEARKPEARQAAALERAAAALAAAARHRHVAEGATLAQAARLAAAIARVTTADGQAPASLAALAATMLARVGVPVPVRLVADPAAAEALRPHLAEIATRAGFAGELSLTPDPALGEGVIRLVWPAGWLEHDPAELARRVADLLATAGTVPPEMTTIDAGAPDEPA